LTDNGFHTIEALQFVPKKALIAIKGLSESKVLKLLEEG
jgi:hypothetical protein